MIIIISSLFSKFYKGKLAFRIILLSKYKEKIFETQEKYQQLCNRSNTQRSKVQAKAEAKAKDYRKHFILYPLILHLASPLPSPQPFLCKS